MHIPDGYLSPASAGALYGLVLPFWYTASRKLRRLMSGRTVPVMALASAFCFVIQMLNIPLPGGTTGHASGAGLAAIVLGPWPAVLAVSVALMIQALFFADGGITTLGANCFNMAVAQVFVSYYLYSMMSKRIPKTWAAGIAGYVGLNVAAILTGLELGLQPLLAGAADGTPLYAPYPLSIAMPAMIAGHLLAGFAEAIVTASAIGFLQRSSPELLTAGLPPDQKAAPLPLFWRRLRTLWIVLGILVLLTPLGLLAPGTAWGEWGSEQLHELGLGFVPQGMQRWEGFWRGLLPDYVVPGAGETAGYLISAAAGVLIILAIFRILTWLGRREVRAATGE